jgi:hypothetical protein
VNEGVDGLGRIHALVADYVEVSEEVVVGIELDRPVAGDSDLAEAIKIMARAHQSAIWSRQRQVNALRSALREYYPATLEAFGTDLGWTSSATATRTSSAE